MKLPLLGAVSVAALLAASAIIAAACGGGEELTVEEYFQEFERLREDAAERMDLLVGQLTADVEPGASEQEQMQLAAEVMTAGLPITEDLVDSLKNLDPPAEVEDAHNKLVEAGEDTVQALEDFAERAADVESMSELNELLEGEAVLQAGARADQACVDLQDIADANGINVDLDCGQ